MVSSNIITGTPLNQLIAFNFSHIQQNLIAYQGGTFLMGNDQCPNASPAHEVTLSAFQVPRDFVTVGDWRRLEETLQSVGGYRSAAVASHPLTGRPHLVALGKSSFETRVALDSMKLDDVFIGGGMPETFGACDDFARSIQIFALPEKTIFDHKCDGNRQPAGNMSYPSSVVYALLHGGQLVTGAQWEYVARVTDESGQSLRPLRDMATPSGRWPKENEGPEPFPTNLSYPAEVDDERFLPLPPYGVRQWIGNASTPTHWFAPYTARPDFDPAGPIGPMNVNDDGDHHSAYQFPVETRGLSKSYSKGWVFWRRLPAWMRWANTFFYGHGSDEAAQYWKLFYGTSRPVGSHEGIRLAFGPGSLLSGVKPSPPAEGR